MNAVVLIQDSNVIRGKWKMGRVKKVSMSYDNKVCRVIVAYKTFPPTERANRYPRYSIH